MVIVSGRMPIKPERRERAVEVVTTMVAATKPEAGCIVYDFYSDLTDPNIFHFYEEWETAEALQAHCETPHMAELQRNMPDILAGKVSASKYEVTTEE